MGQLGGPLKFYHGSILGHAPTGCRAKTTRVLVVDTSRRASTKQAMGGSDPGGSKHPCFFRWVEACSSHRPSMLGYPKNLDMWPESWVCSLSAPTVKT